MRSDPLALLLAIAGTLTVVLLGLAARLVVLVVRNRRRRRQTPKPTFRLVDVPEVAVGGSCLEVDETDSATDFVQFWMDNEWNQRFG